MGELFQKILGHAVGKHFGDWMAQHYPRAGLVSLAVLAIAAILFGRRSEDDEPAPPARVQCPKCKLGQEAERVRCERCGTLLPLVEFAPPAPRRSNLGLRIVGALAVAAGTAALWPRLPVFTQSSQGLAWQNYIPATEAFSVLMPAPPEHGEQTVSSPIGKVPSHGYLAGGAGASVYGVIFFDLPFSPSVQDRETAVNNCLEGVAGRVLGKRSGRVSARRDTTFLGEPAREVELELSDGSFLLARGFFRGDRLYTLLYGHARDQDEAQDRTRFFESFSFRSPSPRPEPDLAAPSATAVAVSTGASPEPLPVIPKATGWADYIPSSEPFGVTMPASPRVTQDDQVPFTVRTYSCSANGITYVASYVRLRSAELADEDRARARLRSARLELARDLGGAAGEPRFATIDSAPGEEFQVSGGDQRGQARDVRWGNVIVLVATAYPPRADRPLERERFFNSLKLR